jgi:hypothetical protein
LRTNTPLQALGLMNDPIQLEAARHFAERILSCDTKNPSDRIKFGFELATAREPRPDELKKLFTLLDQRLAYYRADPEGAKKFLAVGASPAPAKVDSAELAAYANVASLILNLDETITRN